MFGLTWTQMAIGLIVYMAVIQVLRWRRKSFINSLDPVADSWKYIRYLGIIEHPFVNTKALEFALFRTYAIPSISALLHKTGEFERACGRRYDDTDLLIREFTENPLNSERSNLALQRLNYLHGRYRISNDDYRYVLSVFVTEPIRWCERFSWRGTTKRERDGVFNFWMQIGVRMGITDLPKTVEELFQQSMDFETKHMVFSEDNVKIGDATTALFLSPFPSFLHPMIKPVLYALYDERLRVAMGAPKAPAWLISAVTGGIRGFFFLVGVLMPPRPTWLATRRTAPKTCPVEGLMRPRFNVYEPTYVDGYHIRNLGPESVAKKGDIGEIHTN